MFQQQFEDIHMAILAGRLHGSVSCTLPVHLQTKYMTNCVSDCAFAMVSLLKACVMGNAQVCMSVCV